MSEYPKINSLWKRDMNGDKALIPGEYACPEFATVKNWRISEKVDGTNVRVYISWANEVMPTVQFAGRTKDASLPAPLFETLQTVFRPENVLNAFPPKPVDRTPLTQSPSTERATAARSRPQGRFTPTNPASSCMM